MHVSFNLCMLLFSHVFYIIVFLLAVYLTSLHATLEGFKGIRCPKSIVELKLPFELLGDLYRLFVKIC